MPTAEILPSPIGSQLTSSINKRINPPDPDDKNDFPILIVFDGNVTLEPNDITVSAVDNRNRAVTASVVSFEGKNSVYRAVIRPPEVACVITISLAENVVDEGNPAYEKSIRISTRFPDADAETPTELFNPNRSGLQAIAATPTRIFLVSSTLGSNSFITRIYSYTYSGAGEEIGSAGTSIEQIDFINGEFLTASRFVAKSSL